MMPTCHIALAAAGFLALAASLSRKKKAGWAALIGCALLVPLAARDADPVLALGLLALLAARFARPGATSAADARPSPSPQGPDHPAKPLDE